MSTVDVLAICNCGLPVNLTNNLINSECTHVCTWITNHQTIRVAWVTAQSETDEPRVSGCQWWRAHISTGRMNTRAAPPLVSHSWRAAGSCMPPTRCLCWGSSAGSVRRRDTRCAALARAGGGGGGKRRSGRDGSGRASSRNSPGRSGTRCGCARGSPAVSGTRSVGTDSTSCLSKAAGRAARDSPRSSPAAKARSAGCRVSSPSSAAGSSPCQTYPQTRDPASNSCLSGPLRNPWASWRSTRWETNCALYCSATLFFSFRRRRTWRWCSHISRWASASCRGCPWWPWRWEPRRSTVASPAGRWPLHLWVQTRASWSWCPEAALPGRRGASALHPWLRCPCVCASCSGEKSLDLHQIKTAHLLVSAGARTPPTGGEESSYRLLSSRRGSHTVDATVCGRCAVCLGWNGGHRTVF